MGTTCRHAPTERARAPYSAGVSEENTPEATPEPLTYRLLTGPDDRSFCEKISAALADGYVLYGSPSVTFNGERVICAQAVVLPGTPIGGAA